MHYGVDYVHTLEMHVHHGDLVTYGEGWASVGILIGL